MRTNPPVEILEEILELLSSAQYTEVITMCTHLIEEDTSNAYQYKIPLGHALFQKGMYPNAQEIFLGLVLEGRPFGNEEWSMLGFCFEAQKKYASAVACYERSQQIQPNEPQLKKVRELEKQDIAADDLLAAQLYLKESRIGSDIATIGDMVKKRNVTLVTDIYRNKMVPPSDCYVHILRDNGSYRPIIKGAGGGYLLNRNGKMCILDPGYGFIRNFLEAGYGFGGIDAIVVTHAHDDHMSDLPALSSIFHKARLSERGGRDKVRLYLDESSFETLSSHYLMLSDEFDVRPFIKPGDKDIFVFGDSDPSIKMDVFATTHKVNILRKRPYKGIRTKTVTGVGIGFNIDFGQNANKYILFSSDTGWDQGMEKQYIALKNMVDLAILHVSSIGSESKLLFPNTSGYLYDQHLGMIGTLKFMTCVEPQKVLLSERAAELDNVWHLLPMILAKAAGYNLDNVQASIIGTIANIRSDSVQIKHPY